jgi:hypothetical protein
MDLKTIVLLFFCVFVQMVLGRKGGNQKTTTAAAPAPTANYYPPATYNLVHDYQAGTSKFWSNWNYFTGADPTNGFVKYVSLYLRDANQFSYETESAANKEGIQYNYEGASYFGANYWTQEPNGRDSVRIESKSTYNNVLIIAGFAWVPGS